MVWRPSWLNPPDGEECVMDSFRMIGYDPSSYEEYWEHVPTGIVRVLPRAKVEEVGLEFAFGRVLQLVLDGEGGG